MSIELVDFDKTYEISHPAGAVFTLRHWTNAMQDEVDLKCVIKKDGRIVDYDVALERNLKIDLSVVGWQGILFPGDKTEAPCISENKKKLPVGITAWLQKEIEERAGLRITESEKKN